MNKVPKVSIPRDFRFSLEENWDGIVMAAVNESQALGQVVTPETVFNEEGIIVGWYLHGWKTKIYE